MSLFCTKVWDTYLKEAKKKKKTTKLNASNRCVVKEEQRGEKQREWRNSSWNTFLNLGAKPIL